MEMNRLTEVDCDLSPIRKKVQGQVQTTAVATNFGTDTICIDAFCLHAYCVMSSEYAQCSTLNVKQQKNAKVAENDFLSL